MNKNSADEVGLELRNGSDTVSFVWWRNQLSLGGNSDIWDIGAITTPAYGGQLRAELTIEVDAAGDSTATFGYTGIADPDGNPWSGSASLVGVSSDDFAFDGLQLIVVDGNGIDISGSFDNLSIESYPLLNKFWANTSGGDWFDSPWVNGRPIENHRAVFGDVILASSTVFVDSDVTVNALLFDNDNSYAIAGTASLTLEPGALGDPAVDAIRGAHELQVRVNLGGNSSADISAGASVEFVNRLNLNGHTLTKSGDGTLLINNSFNTGSGTLVGAAGVIGGGGTIGGNLNNSAGIVAPGNSPGTLIVDGDYTQGSGGTLAIELAGTADGEHDLLEVVGSAALAGNLEINLVDEFAPTAGDTFDVLSAAVITYNGLSLTGASDGFSYSIIGGGALAADFNGDGGVDDADLLTWQASFGLNAGGDADADGDTDGNDLLLWQGELGTLGGGGQILRLAFNNSLAGAAVPEPSALALVLLANLALVLRRR